MPIVCVNLGGAKRNRGITRVGVRALLCLLGILFATAADAATGDTFITVAYKVNTVRIKPQPGTGVGAAELRMVFHANGTVDEVLDAKGKHPKKYENKKSKLGKQKGAVHYRVIDKNTIERIAPGNTLSFRSRLWSRDHHARRMSRIPSSLVRRRW